MEAVWRGHGREYGGGMPRKTISQEGACNADDASIRFPDVSLTLRLARLTFSGAFWSVENE